MSCIKKTLLLIGMVVVVILFTTCNFVPAQEFKISTLIEMNATPYDRESFRMSSASEILGNTESMGTVYIGTYRMKTTGQQVTLIAGSTEKNDVADALWKNYRNTDKPPFWYWFNHIPFYYGSYKMEKSADTLAMTPRRFILSWFSKNWFFHIEGPDELTVQDFYAKMELFIQKNYVLNGSIRDI